MSSLLWLCLSCRIFEYKYKYAEFMNMRTLIFNLFSEIGWLFLFVLVHERAHRPEPLMTWKLLQANTQEQYSCWQERTANPASHRHWFCEHFSRCHLLSTSFFLLLQKFKDSRPLRPCLNWRHIHFDVAEGDFINAFKKRKRNWNKQMGSALIILGRF